VPTQERWLVASSRFGIFITYHIPHNCFTFLQ
jgi:hypothetical protein